MGTDARRLNRERFGQTAGAYAGSEIAQRYVQKDVLLHFLAPSPADLFLDVACGPGVLLAACAPHVRRAVGVDLTMAMLAEARRRRPVGPPGVVSLVCAEGERLPFGDGVFTLVAATWAVHHFGEPRQVLAEMVRVCRPGGRVAIGDLVASSDEAKRARQNEIERFRDPAHVEMLSRGELEALLASVGLAITHRAEGDMLREVGEWCEISAAPPDVAARVREMLRRTQPGDLAGMNPVQVNGEVSFRHYWMVLVAEKR